MKKVALLSIGTTFLTTAAFFVAFAQDPPKPAGKTTEQVVARTTVNIPADPPKAAPKPQDQKSRSGAVTPQSFGHQVTLSWTAPTTCTDGSPCTASSYNIYKAATACPSGSAVTGATKVASTPAGTTTYVDTNIVAPGSYCYYVTAVNSQGESTASNSAGGSLAQPLLNAPGNLTATLQ